MDSSTPATKYDVQAVKEDVRFVKDDVQAVKEDVRFVKDDLQALRGDVRVVKEDVKRLEKKFEKLYDADDQILAVLTNIDKRLTPKVENHEKRIVRLEEAVA